MASEYSVNIKLNTSQVKKDLKTIGDGIGNLGKKQSRGAKSALSDAEKQLKLENQSLRLQNQGLGLTLKALPLKKKGVDFESINLQITDGINKAKKFEFDLARKSLLLSDKEIKKEQIILKATENTTKSKVKQLKLQRQLASPIGGSKYMMGSPAQMAFSGGPSVPIGGSRFITGSPAQLAYSARVGGPRSPIGGLPSIPGSPAALKGRRGFDFQSALISGGFPLLFGQGPITAAAGALGGGIGGMFGQMGGFAGGIAATAAVQAIQNTIASISKLGQAFNTLTPDVEGLTAALGASGTEREKQIQLIKKTEGTQAALAVVTEQLNQQIGEKGVKNLKEFGETTRLIGNAFQLLGTKMLAALAPVINLLATPITAEATRAETNRLANIGGANTDQELQNLQTRLNNVGTGRSANKQRERIQRQIEARKEELAIIGKGLERQQTINLVEDSRLKKIRQQNDLLKAKINGNHEEVLLAQQVNEIAKAMQEDGLTEQEIDRKKIEDLLTQNNLMEKQAQQAEKVKQQFASLGQSLATDVADGLQGLIRGTSTLGDMLNNVLNKMIDAAFNMALFGNPGGQLGGGGLFGSIFGGLGSMFGGGGLASSASLGAAATAMTGIPSGANLLPGSFGISSITRAAGGPVKGGSGYLVGERGPEMFTPGVSGMITPNHALGGSTTVIVNVDASGSAVEGDEEQGRELGRLISAAVQSEIIQQKRPGGILA